MSDNHYPKAFQKLIRTISRLPGIGRRSAERMALALYEWPEDDLKFFGEQLSALKENVKSCQKCGNFADDDLCNICLDHERNSQCICVVESAAQIPVIEKSGSFNGHYHVLGGRLSPLNGVGPMDLNLNNVQNTFAQAEELILATSPDFEGEATASYIAEQLKSFDVKITRIARGIPVGADISYADAASMAMAINSRSDV